MFKIMIDAVLFPSMFAYMSGILFAGTWANLGNPNSNGAKRALPLNSDGSGGDQAEMLSIFSSSR